MRWALQHPNDPKTKTLLRAAFGPNYDLKAITKNVKAINNARVRVEPNSGSHDDMSLAETGFNIYGQPTNVQFGQQHCESHFRLHFPPVEILTENHLKDNSERDARVATIIHEVSHYAADTGDFVNMKGNGITRFSGKSNGQDGCKCTLVCILRC